MVPGLPFPCIIVDCRSYQNSTAANEDVFTKINLHISQNNNTFYALAPGSYKEGRQD